MDATTQTHVDNLTSADKETQNQAYYALLAATEQPVDWAYDIWDDLVAYLSHKDNHLRAIAAQLLSNLAISDPDYRMKDAFAALLNGTRDERFVTARHTLQSIWKVGLAGEPQRELVLNGLSQRYEECVSEKNSTLIRYDIAQALRNLYDATQDDAIKTKALALIETEEDAKYRKKYATAWKNA